MKLSIFKRMAILAITYNHLYLTKLNNRRLIKDLEELDIVREWNGGHKLTAHGTSVAYEVSLKEIHPEVARIFGIN